MEGSHDAEASFWILLLMVAVGNGGVRKRCFRLSPAAPILTSQQGDPDGRWEGMGAEIRLDSAPKCPGDLFSLLMVGSLWTMCCNSPLGSIVYNQKHF